MRDDLTMFFYQRRAKFSMPQISFPSPFKNHLLFSFITNWYNYRLEPRFCQYEALFEQGNLLMAVFDQLITHVDPQKSPGFPLFFVQPQNGQLDKGMLYMELNERHKRLKDFGLQLSKLSNDELDKMLSIHYPREYAVELAITLVKAGIVDPVYMNVKGEARKIGKTARLVCAVSLLDNLIASLLLRNVLTDEQTRDVPTAVALDLVTPAKTRQMYDSFVADTEYCDSLASSDVQGWEYSNSSNFHFLPMIKNLIILNVGRFDDDERLIPVAGKETQYWTIVAHYVSTNYRVLVTKEGRLFVPRPGQVSSGCLETFSASSFKRGFASSAVTNMHGVLNPCSLDGTMEEYPSAEWFDHVFGSDDDLEALHTAGDDCLDSNQRPEPHKYRALGLVVTDYAKQDSTTGFDFCSTRFTSQGAYLCNIEKFFVNMMFKRPSPEEVNEMMASATGFSLHPDYMEYIFLIEEYKMQYRAAADGRL